jgi:hypothetical protein
MMAALARVLAAALTAAMVAGCATRAPEPDDPYVCGPPEPRCAARCEDEFARRSRPDAWEYQSCLRACQKAPDGGKCY